MSNHKIKAKKSYDFRGAENGIRKEYYENGQIKIKCEVKDDMPLGGFVSWYPDGQKQSERIYETQTIDLSDGEESHPTQDISCLTINYWDFHGNQKIIDGNGHLYDYYENGRIKEDGKITDGRKNGFWHGYYENGNSCYLEKYENGSLVEGESISTDSTRKLYEVLRVMPYPKEGFKKLYKQIKKNMQYPRAARKNGIQGRVYVQFLVKESGELSDFSILKGISLDCDYEALNALRNTKGEWQPGLLRGIPSDIKFVFPVTFRL